VVKNNYRRKEMMLKKEILYVILVSLLFVGCSTKQKAGKIYNAATMKPYKVMGKKYKPTKVAEGEVKYGISSWYGPKFHGKKTSNGEIYNMYAQTAAHKTWPMNTMVKVTNLENEKSTIVRINDRGPFVQGRVIDCSYVAGKKIGLDTSGIARVKLEVVGTNGVISTWPRYALFTPKPVKPALNPRVKPVIKQAWAQSKSGNYKLQVGAFSRYIGAQSTASRYGKISSQYNPVIQSHYSNGRKIYRVMLDGFPNKETLLAFKERHNLRDARVVVTN
jgi:rare lipoprotein A